MLSKWEQEEEKNLKYYSAIYDAGPQMTSERIYSCRVLDNNHDFSGSIQRHV
jgi:hypothetical protein